MPIVIHEFEVISAPPAPAADAAGSEPATAAPQLRPEDIEAIWRQQQARAERVHAD